ncbi:hypothetical protein MBLNU13_g09945t1 [Cladosporium sp. NU13]
MAIDLPLESEQKPTKTIPAKCAQNGLPNHSSQDEAAMKSTPGAVFELVITNGKGYGLFATDSIPRGTRILKESPLVTISPSSSPKNQGPPSLDIEELTTVLDGLSPEQHEACFELYHDPPAVARARKCILKAQEHVKQEMLGQKFPNAHKIESTVKLYAIYETNVVRLGDDETSGLGVFTLASRINHSCVPNLQIHYIPETQELVAHAVRHINKGEELTINYYSVVWMPRRRRDHVFGDCSFECACRSCTGPQATAGQLRREAMLKLECDLAAFDRPDRYPPHFGAPRSPQQALEVGEKLIELLKAEGIADQNLQKVYRRCSKYCLKAGMFDQAVTFAKKERDVERYCIGADTAQMAHLEADHKGPEFWHKYVLSERQLHHIKQKAARKWLKDEMAHETMAKTKKGGKGKKK